MTGSLIGARDNSTEAPGTTPTTHNIVVYSLMGRALRGIPTTICAQGAAATTGEFMKALWHSGATTTIVIGFVTILLHNPRRT